MDLVTCQMRLRSVNKQPFTRHSSMELVNACLALSPASPAVLTLLCILQRKAKKFAPSDVSVRRALELLRQYRDCSREVKPIVNGASGLRSLIGVLVCSNWGHNHLKNGQIEDAERVLLHARLECPTLWSTYSHLAQVARQQNQPEKATRYLQKAFFLNPTMFSFDALCGKK
eukprot:TRINITY_DN5620_c0_g2_i7.p1 TRINITY_DN5620_c0_g2~~TRINITY_DN5620_c0_g2_i7.p1  ORF type:complete len:172 (+),score=34.07 TRINITY_DN5620_c0_g2_i7:60-575(+)